MHDVRCAMWEVGGTYLRRRAVLFLVILVAVVVGQVEGRVEAVPSEVLVPRRPCGGGNEALSGEERRCGEAAAKEEARGGERRREEARGGACTLPAAIPRPW